MQAVVGALRVNLGLDSAQFRDGLRDARSELKRAGQQMQAIGAGLTAAVTAPLVLAARNMVTLFGEQERALALVEQGVISTGGAAGKTAEELAMMASELQAITAFGDEVILKQVTAQLLTFTNIAGEQFERAQIAALDLATVLDRDLTSISIQLGKALNDPVRGLSSLSEAGIQFSDDQREVIKALVETGQVAEAQTMILDELAKQYGGQATAAASTFTGQTQQLANAWGDVREEFGAIIVDLLPPLIEALRGVVDFLGRLSPETQKWVIVIGGLSAALGPVLLALGTFATIIAGLSAPVLAVVAAVAALTAGLVAFWPEIMAAKDAVQRFIADGLERIKELPAEIVAAMSSLPGEMLRLGRQTIDGLVEGLRSRVDSVRETVTDTANGLAQWFRDAVQIQSPSRVFMRIGQQIMEGLGLGIENTAPAVEGQLAGATGSLLDDVRGMFRAVLIEGESFKSALSSLLGTTASRLFDNAFTGLFSGLRIPGFASGTTYAPGGLALVGEEGPELVSLPRGSRVFSNEVTRGMLSGGAGGASVAMNVSIDATGADAVALARVEREVERLRADMPALVVDNLRRAGNRGVIERVLR